ncbi:hypothetical protein [Arthrobacter sp. MW3 TE3886]|uniref:hypothetical protein n=1 Tax=Arthrobacter sp. MW3 TE3886 TaxID=3156254 RepID=UPI0035183E6F
MGQRLRRAAQLHYRAESASPRADAPANDSASDDRAGNRPADVSVNTRAHAFANDPDDDTGTPCADTAAGGHTDHRANVRANVRASHRADDPGNARPANVPATFRANASADGRANHPANVRANDPANIGANDPANIGANHPTNVRANVGATVRANDRANDIVHTCVDGIADARTDIARAYPLKRSYSPRFTSAPGFTSDR